MFKGLSFFCGMILCFYSNFVWHIIALDTQSLDTFGPCLFSPENLNPSRHKK